MATSGSVDFSVTRDELINLAHQHIGALGEGETCTTAQVTEAAKLLNMIVKARAADGMPLWALKIGYVLPFTDSNSIAVTSHVVTSYTQTTASADSASGASTITVTSVTGFTDGYPIGIELSDSTMLWTTISGAPAGNVVTLATALTEDVTSGAVVYTYATANRVTAPLRIVDGYQKNVLSNSEYPLQQIGRDEYYGLGVKNSPGSPSQYYYDPQLVTTPSIYFYPRFSGGQVLFYFTYVRPFEDFDASTDTPDFPQAFYLALMTELAAMLGPKFGVGIRERTLLMQEANMHFERALSSTYPEGSIFLQPYNRHATG